MSKKKLVKDKENNPKVVKVIRPSVALGLGVIAVMGAVFAGSVCGNINAKNDMQNITKDFANNNIEYREYIARKNAEVDYKYNNGSGDMTFQEWMNKKSDVNSMNNVEDAINLFADDDVKKEYFDKKQSATDFAILSYIEGAVTFVSAAVTTSDIVDKGFTKEKIKYKKEKDEDEKEL